MAKQTNLWLIVPFGIALGAIGCGGGSTPMGGERQRCYPNMTCNVGLTCLSDTCVNTGGTAGTGGSGRGGSGGAAGTGGSATGTGGTATGGAAGGTGGTATGTGGSGGTGGAVGPPPTLGAQIDRMGRAQINTLLTDPFDASSSTRGMKKDMYSLAIPATASSFETGFEISLAIFDAMDSNCGNQFLAAAQVTPTQYKQLADLLLDDQIYLNANYGACTIYLAVELDALNDCGGRTPTMDVVDATYSTLIGAGSGVTDGLTADDKAQSNTVFPFLAAPN
ncbi:MAG TPA: hypothetical protein VKQ32_22340 [Polyangia bacterium]|nr:hypothetical protein [Polyangia bacterium]